MRLVLGPESGPAIFFRRRIGLEVGPAAMDAGQKRRRACRELVIHFYRYRGTGDYMPKGDRDKLKESLLKACNNLYYYW